MKIADPLRLHRVHNISNTAYEIFRTRCLKYYAHGEHVEKRRGEPNLARPVLDIVSYCVFD